MALKRRIVLQIVLDSCSSEGDPADAARETLGEMDYLEIEDLLESAKVVQWEENLET